MTSTIRAGVILPRQKKFPETLDIGHKLFAMRLGYVKFKEKISYR
jgi:ribosomal protein L27